MLASETWLRMLNRACDSCLIFDFCWSILQIIWKDLPNVARDLKHIEAYKPVSNVQPSVIVRVIIEPIYISASDKCICISEAT